MDPLWTLEFLLAEARRAVRLATSCLDGVLSQAIPHVDSLRPGSHPDTGEGQSAQEDEEDAIPEYVPRRRRRRRRRR
ncbi:MAG: hypothetical protein RDU89_00380 [bacterium]|nr:hypothetical protein [bacterium]